MPAECIDVIRTHDVVPADQHQNGFRAHPLPPIAPSDDLLALMTQRRSIRRLRSGPWSEAIVERLLEAVRLTPPIQLTLESAVEFIADDELVEITPKSIRLRKRHLSGIERKRQARAAA